jgi:hypothetical protein
MIISEASAHGCWFHCFYTQNKAETIMAEKQLPLWHPGSRELERQEMTFKPRLPMTHFLPPSPASWPPIQPGKRQWITPSKSHRLHKPINPNSTACWGPRLDTCAFQGDASQPHPSPPVPCLRIFIMKGPSIFSSLFFSETTIGVHVKTSLHAGNKSHSVVVS